MIKPPLNILLLQDATAGAMRRKRANERFLASEQRLSLAVDAAELGIFDWHIGAAKIIWSFHHPQLFGLPPRQFDGTLEGFERCVHPDDRLGVDAAIRKSAAAHGDFRHEYRVIGATDGSQNPLTVLSVSIHAA